MKCVVTEGLSPLFVSVHATDPDTGAERWSRRGATSLALVRAPLDAGIEIDGQVVVRPGVNDGEVLEDTLAGVLDEYPEMASVACVRLGVSRYNREQAMRAHTAEEARQVVDLVEEWQGIFGTCVGRRLVYASDEYYLLAGRTFPPLGTYGAVARTTMVWGWLGPSRPPSKAAGEELGAGTERLFPLLAAPRLGLPGRALIVLSWFGDLAAQQHPQR